MPADRHALTSDPSELSADRTELKYLLDPRAVPALRRELDQRLHAQHYGSAQSVVATMAAHYTTTVYFDSESGQLYRAARSGKEHVKLRAREYYDVLPLAEHATHLDDLLRSTDVLWIELKLREHDQSHKLRVGVPKRRLPRFLESGVVDSELLEIQRQAYGAQGEQMLIRMLRFFEGLDGPLRVSCIVNYRRSAWQDPPERVRVTLDESLSVFAPNHELWRDEAPLTRERLGQPLHREAGVVAEVKLRGQMPAWLDAAMSSTGTKPLALSKFVLATEAVHSSRVGARRGDVTG